MDSALVNTLLKIVTRIHIFLYRTSGGRLWGRQSGLPVLLLTTTGRKSGLERTTPVIHVREGDDYIIAASKGGSERHPAWYHNLKANPQVRLELGSDRHSARAIITEGEERDRLYALLEAGNSDFTTYKNRTDRQIPVIRLSPA